MKVEKFDWGAFPRLRVSNPHNPHGIPPGELLVQLNRLTVLRLPDKEITAKVMAWTPYAKLVRAGKKTQESRECDSKRFKAIYDQYLTRNRKAGTVVIIGVEYLLNNGFTVFFSSHKYLESCIVTGQTIILQPARVGPTNFWSLAVVEKEKRAKARSKRTGR